MKIWLYIFTLANLTNRLSANAQLERMTRFCTAEKHDIVGISSDTANFPTELPNSRYNGFQAALAAYQSGTCDFILVASCDLLKEDGFIHEQLWNAFWDAPNKKARLITPDRQSLKRLIFNEVMNQCTDQYFSNCTFQQQREHWLMNECLCRRNQPTP